MKPDPQKVETGLGHKREACGCGSMRRCLDCIQDDNVRRAAEEEGSLVLPHYRCPDHKDYRTYQDLLLKFANWSVVITTIMTVPVLWPLISIANNLNVNLVNVFAFCGIIINGAVLPLSMGIAWDRASPRGLMVGAVGGSLIGMLAWLLTAVGQGSLTLDSAVSKDALIAGNVVALLASGLICFVVSKMTGGGTFDWTKTLRIDNPLTPWMARYERELGVKESARYADVPNPDYMHSIFKVSRVWISSAFQSLPLLT